MSRKLKTKEKGFVFETKGTDFDEISTSDLAGKTVSFDAHEITGKIIEFGKVLTGLSLYDYQYDIAYSVIYSVITFSGDVKTVLLSRQSGKSEVMAFIIDTLTVLLPALAKIIPDLEQFSSGFRIGLFAPQSDQVSTTYSRAMTRLDSANAEMIMSDPDIDIYAESEARLELSNGSFLMGQTASKQSKIESKTYDLVIIEEAQDVDDFLASKSIEPMVSACITAGNKVWNNKGNLVNIEDLVISEGILGYDGKGVSKEPITYWQKPTKKECYKIITHTGRTLECSYDHPILYRERKGGMYGRKMFFRETHLLEEGNQIAIIEEVPIWGSKEMWEPRLVGQLIGDGSYGKDSTPCLSTCDKEIYMYVKSNFDWSYSREPRKTVDGKLYQEIRIKGICENLRELGIYGQTKQAKRLPDNFHTYSKESMAELLGGFFDADGHVTYTYRRGQIGLTSNVYELLDEVRFALQKFGVHCLVTVTKPSETSYGKENYYVLSINDKRSIKAFHKNISFSIKDKQDKLTKLVGILKGRGCKIPKESKGLRFERIVSIEKSGVKEVYNLTADATNTYIASGIVTHNTSGTIIKVGTTGTSKNHFWTEIQYNRNHDRRLKDQRIRKHLEFAYKPIIRDRRKQFEIDGRRFHLNYEADILRKRDRWGETSQEFKLAYALVWDLESGMLITDKEYNNLLNRKKGFGVTSDRDFVVAGLDIGKSPASTILTIVRVIEKDDVFDKPTKEIIGWVDLGGLDYEIQHHAILDAIVEYNISTIFADYTGVGKPVVDRLIYSCGEWVNIEPYPFTAQSKSDMWYSLTSDIATKRIIIPANKTVRGSLQYQNFEEQMKNCQKYFNGSYMVCEKLDGYHDDYVDSLGLACLAANDEREVDLEIEVLDNPLYQGVKDVMGAIKRNSYT